MENTVKTTITSTNPKTGEIHHMEFDSYAVCVVLLKDEGEGIKSQEVITGRWDLNRALAGVKSLASASSHLLEQLPPHISSIVKMEMLSEIMGKTKHEEEEETADELA